MTRTTLGCLLSGHIYGDEWTLRPAWVGADISIEAVHFDRACTRCGHLDTIWSRVEGDTASYPGALPLSAWLNRNAATVERPSGVIRLPEGGTF